MRNFCLLCCVVLSLFCAGCSYVNAVAGGWDKTQLQQRIKDDYNANMQGSGEWVQRVELTQESPNKFVGTMVFSNSRGEPDAYIPTTVITDKDSYKVQPS